VAGPVALATPEGVERVDVRSAAQMHAAVMAALPADIFIGAAAVADFTPATVAAEKIKKRHGEDGLVLQLVRTADILADVAASAARPVLVVGFAAETGDVEANARAKLEGKRLDLVCANRVGVAGSGFESDDNALLVLGHGLRVELGPASKTELATALLDIVAQRLPAR
ncbi:phosphopantothenoylcysteine decarboxylase, partial [Lysobacter zhanggongensis]